MPTGADRGGPGSVDVNPAPFPGCAGEPVRRLGQLTRFAARWLFRRSAVERADQGWAGPIRRERLGQALPKSLRRRATYVTSLPAATWRSGFRPAVGGRETPAKAAASA